MGCFGHSFTPFCDAKQRVSILILILWKVFDRVKGVLDLRATVDILDQNSLRVLNKGETFNFRVS